MSNPVPVVAVARAAAGIANARGGRRGVPPIKNVLEILPRRIFDEVMEDAREALAAAGVGALVAAAKAYTANDGIFPDAASSKAAFARLREAAMSMEGE